MAAVASYAGVAFVASIAGAIFWPWAGRDIAGPDGIM